MSAAQPPFQFERRKHPRTTNQPPFVAGAIDPDLTRRSRTIAPGKLLAMLAIICFAAMAFSTPVHNFLVAYNDNIVAILIGLIPALLVAVFMLGRRLYAFWRANVKVAAEIEAQRRAQASAARETTRLTEPNLHLLPQRPGTQTRAA